MCPIILVELLGAANLPNTFGFLNFSRGVANLIGPPLAGTLEPIWVGCHSYYYAGREQLPVIPSHVSQD